MSVRQDAVSYRRRRTRVVHVGDVAVGGENPIRVQSMTTPATTDTGATVDQILRLADAGCEIVRLTVPTSADAENLPNIRRELAARGVRLPLVADIHFTPAAAMKAVEHVEKIRINPGNYADKKKFAAREYTEDEYRSELDRIERVFSPLVARCRELGVAMRIGTNHGSLSDRIMNRYGDSPEGMVESALEFVRICEAHDYRDLILSMKSSNPVVVLLAYRLLVDRMAEEDMGYPLHLGVTEAGEGEDARIKSAIGIGALLDEGIGDTVRVSLTEDPVAEIPVARALVAPYNRRLAEGTAFERGSGPAVISDERRGHHHFRRKSRTVSVGPREIGGSHPVLVEVPLLTPPSDEQGIRRELDAEAGSRVPEETRADLLSVSVASEDGIDAVERLRRSVESVAPSVALSVRLEGEPTRFSASDLARLADVGHRLHVRVSEGPTEPNADTLLRLIDATAREGRALLVEGASASGSATATVEFLLWIARQASDLDHVLLALDPSTGPSPLLANRHLAARLAEERLDPPLVLLDRPDMRSADPLLGPSCAIGGLLCEGIGDAVQIRCATAAESRKLSFGVLQAARVRITRTEFISCPSCGRTLFDLEETTARVRARTAHLKGVKIAVMGCIVNGPGEMADADFGYVGWGEDKIALFVGKELVEKDIPTDQAEDRLVELIKRCGRWADPPVPAPG